MTTQRYTHTDGRVFATELARPWFVRPAGGSGRERHFGSLPAARGYLRSVGGRGRIFFDMAPGTGVLVEHTT